MDARMKRRGRMLTLVCGVASAGLAAGVLLPSVGAGVASAQVTPTNTTFYNTIWAGYAASGSPGAFTSVSADWTEPTLTCGAGSSYSSYWVGLDGYNSNTVEQVGTEADCVGGEQTDYAWYEMYPKFGAKIVTVPVSPGDMISASVDYSAAASGHGPGSFTLTLTNTTTGETSTTTVKSPSARLSSAEVIAEAPSSNHGPFSALTLANFNTVTFSAATVGTAAGTETLEDAAPDPLVITTTGTAAGTVEATPGSLSGGDFTVYRENA